MEMEPLRPTGRATRRSRARISPVLSVALVGLIVGLLVGFGVGYRLGTTTPNAGPTATQDLLADTVSSRLERAFTSTAPDGWAVCGLATQPTCHHLVPGTTNLPREPEVRFGEGWYSDPGLTTVNVGIAHDVLAASIGEGSVLAWLNRLGPGDEFLDVTELTPVSPGRHGQDYFDLGPLEPGHYVVQVDFIPVPPAESAGQVTFYIVGFIVG